MTFERTMLVQLDDGDWFVVLTYDATRGWLGVRHLKSRRPRVIPALRVVASYRRARFQPALAV